MAQSIHISACTTATCVKYFITVLHCAALGCIVIAHGQAMHGKEQRSSCLLTL